jgi:hypothetical protein
MESGHRFAVVQDTPGQLQPSESASKQYLSPAEDGVVVYTSQGKKR